MFSACDPSSDPSLQKSTNLMCRPVSATVLKSENMVISYTLRQLPSHHHWKGTPQKSLVIEKKKSWSAHSLSWEIKVVGKSHYGSVTDYQCWGNFWVSPGSHLYRVQDRHGAQQPSEAWCRTQMQICLCTQTWKRKRKRLKEWSKKGIVDNTAKNLPSKMALLRKKLFMVENN